MRPRTLVPLLVLAAAASAPAQHPEVTAVRHWTFADITRIAIETSGPVRFRPGRLANPDRLIFDLYGAAPRSHGRRITSRVVNDRLVKRVRVAELRPGITRLVLDLEAPVDFTASQLSNPDRLIVELRSRGSVTRPPLTVTTTLEPHVARPPATIQPALLFAAAHTRVFMPPPAPVRPLRAMPVMVEPPWFYPRFPYNSAWQVFAQAEPHPAAPVMARVRRKAIERATLAEPIPAPAVTPSLKSLREHPAEKATFTSSAKAAKLAATQSMTRALGLKINRVVIDAGHGGHDQGTSGPNGLLEKDLTLDVAQRLGQLIQQRLGSEVIYTRSDDTYIALKERTAIANRNKADLFLSIHANSSPASSVTGVETYYLNFTNSAESLSLAARENATSENSVYDLKDLIQTITLHEKIEESKEFASCVQASLQTFENRSFPASKNRGIRKAPFVVLIGASMPSVLAEIGFVSNSREESQLSKSAYRQKLAEALFSGVSRYSDSLSHFTTKRSAFADSEESVRALK
jgi:N-acetylmuramoyl-L-alanine amidase